MDRAILNFLFQLDFGPVLSGSAEIMNPYKREEVRKVCRSFYTKYYSDHSPRILIMGINPGRYGGGITGIPFTDPIRLEKDCEIPNPFYKKPETSSVFIYEMIDAFGGPSMFFSYFLVSAMSPLGFTSQGKNLNYYDHKDLYAETLPFITGSIRKQLAIPGIGNHTALCIGEGKNFKILKNLNQEFGFFKEVLPLPHPRYIMQYRYKRKQEYIQNYLETLKSVLRTR